MYSSFTLEKLGENRKRPEMYRYIMIGATSLVKQLARKPAKQTLGLVSPSPSGTTKAPPFSPAYRPRVVLGLKAQGPHNS